MYRSWNSEEGIINVGLVFAGGNKAKKEIVQNRQSFTHESLYFFIVFFPLSMQTVSGFALKSGLIHASIQFVQSEAKRMTIFSLSSL